MSVVIRVSSWSVDCGDAVEAVEQGLPSVSKSVQFLIRDACVFTHDDPHADLFHLLLDGEVEYGGQGDVSVAQRWP